MTLFNKVKIKVKAKRNVGLQNKNYQRKGKERTGVVKGPYLVSVGSQLFESNFVGNVGDTVTVTNIGTPAVALYAQSTTGATSSNGSGSGNVTVVSDGALATIQAHVAQGYVEAHATSPATRQYHSIKYGVVGGGIGEGVDETTHLRTMFNTVGENGGGHCIVASADGVSPIIIDGLVSIYHSNMTIEFRSPVLLGAAGGIRVMGEMVEYVVGATFAGGLATGSPASEGDTTITLSTTSGKMQASNYSDGMLITLRGENDETGAALTKQQVVIVSRNTGANTLTFAQELEYDFDPTYPSSAYSPTDATTIFPNLTWALAADIERGDMTATVTDSTGMTVGHMVRLYDTRVEVDLNAAAIRGSGLPYENECRLEYITITDIDPGTDTVTFDRPVSKSYLAGSPYFGGIADVAPVENVHIRGIVATYYEAQTSKNAHAISLNFAKDCTIENCKIDGSGGGMGQMFRISDSLNCWVIDSIGENPAYHESGQGYIFTNYKSDRSGHRNCMARGGRHNFLMQACTNWLVDTCTSYDAWISGIDAHGVDEYDGMIINCRCSQMNNHPGDASNGACARVGNTSHYVGTHWTSILDCVFFGNYETNIAAIDFLAASSHLVVDGCKIYGGYYGIKNSKNPDQCTPPTPITDVIVRNCDFYNITNRPIYLEGVPDTAGGTRSSSKIAGMLIEGCTDWNCTQHIHITGGDAISSLTISECQSIMPITSPANDYYGLVITDVDGLMVRNNNFHLCSRGISLTDATNACVIGNTLTATIDAIPITLAGTNTGPGGGALIYVGNIVDNTSVGGSASPDFTSDVSITGTDPQLTFIESDAATDNKRYDILANNEGFFVRVVNDAANAAANIMAVQRTANTIDSIDLTATNINLNGIVNLAGGSSAFTSNPVVTNTSPAYVWIETGVTANNTRWRIFVDNMVMYYQLVNDANSSATSWMYVGRSGNTVTSVDIAAAAIGLGGEVTATGDITVSNTSPQLLLNETDATTDNRLWDFLANGATLFLRAVNDAKSSASTWLAVTRSGITVTAVNIAATAINLAGNVITDGYSRVRQVGNSRYRLDNNVSAAAAKLTAYDDTGSVYIPLAFEASTTSIKPNGGASVFDATSTGVAVTGTVTTTGPIVDGNGGFMQHVSFGPITPGTVLDILPNLASRAAGVTLIGNIKHSTIANASAYASRQVYSGFPYDIAISTDTLRFTCSTGGKVTATHYAGSSGNISGSILVMWAG